MIELPKNKVDWLAQYRAGLVENIYGDFSCEYEDCTCLFGNLADSVIHSLSGSHGRMGDRYAEQNRRKFKYFTRTGRVKEDIYREESRSIEQENNGQEHLNK